jgi:hypothetical protein
VLALPFIVTALALILVFDWLDRRVSAVSRRSS